MNGGGRALRGSRPRGGVAILTAALIAGLAGLTQAQTVPQPQTAPQAVDSSTACVGQPVVRVLLQVVGHRNYPQSLLSLVDVKAQQPFTREAWRSSVQLLTKLGGFEEVDVNCLAMEGGYAVVFVASPPHPVTELEFRGAHDLTGALTRTLRKGVLDRYGGMPARVPPPVVQTAVIDMLKEEGYVDATAEVTLKKYTDPDRATLIFNVVLGTRARYGQVTIVAPNETAVPKDWVVRETGAVEGRPYQPSRIDHGFARIINTLKSRGYYTASTLPIERTPGTDHTFDVTLTIDSGPAVVLEWQKGGDPPPGDITDYVPVRQQNSIDKDLLDDADTRIETLLRNQGYLDAKVTYVDAPAPGDRQAITYLVTKGARYRIDHVQFPSGLALTEKELDTMLEVRPREVYDPVKINLGLRQIQAELNRRGYYLARVTPVRVPAANRPSTPKETWIVLAVEIVQGVKGETVNVSFERASTQVPEEDLRQVIQAIRGSAFQAGMNDAVETAVKTLYDNLGYRSAAVRVRYSYTADGKTLNRIVHIDEGTRLVVKDVTVIGANDIKEQEIRDQIVLHAGDAFGATTQRVSQSRLYNWGVFRQVTIEPLDPPRPTDSEVHLIVRVIEAPDTTISYGGDVEAGYKKRTVSVDPSVPLADRLEWAPRGFFEIGRRNLGGRNRVLDLFTRLSLRPRDTPGDPVHDGKGYRPSEYRVAVTYAEKNAFGSRIDWVFGLTSEQAVRTTFNFRRQAVNVDFTRRLSQRLTANLRYTLGFTNIYNQRFCANALDFPNNCTLQESKDVAAIDRVFPQVRLSIVSVDILSDRRDDPAWPTKGSFITGDTEIALRGIGSEVGYTKTFIQAAKYGHFKGTRRVVAAGRIEFGVARGFARPNPADPTAPIADLPASQRFFAGGSTTVRGYQLDALGTPGLITSQGLSVGGNGLIVLNFEMREILGKLFGRQFAIVQFFDAGNVFAKVKDMLHEPLRSSYGGGVRYDSWVGPLRFDFAIKTHRMTYGTTTTFAGVRERAWEFHLSFGQAF